MDRHRGLEWPGIQKKLEAHPEKLSPLRGIQLIANELNGPIAQPVGYITPYTVLGVPGSAFSTQAHAESVKWYGNYNSSRLRYVPDRFLQVVLHRLLISSAHGLEVALKIMGAEPPLIVRCGTRHSERPNGGRQSRPLARFASGRFPAYRDSRDIGLGLTQRRLWTATAPGS